MGRPRKEEMVAQPMSPPADPLVTIDVPTQVTINGVQYFGKRTVPLSVAGEIKAMVSKWNDHVRSVIQQGPVRTHEATISGAQG